MKTYSFYRYYIEAMGEIFYSSLKLFYPQVVKVWIFGISYFVTQLI